MSKFSSKILKLASRDGMFVSLGKFENQVILPHFASGYRWLVNVECQKTKANRQFLLLYTGHLKQAGQFTFPYVARKNACASSGSGGKLDDGRLVLGRDAEVCIECSTGEGRINPLQDSTLELAKGHEGDLCADLTPIFSGELQEGQQLDVSVKVVDDYENCDVVDFVSPHTKGLLYANRHISWKPTGQQQTYVDWNIPSKDIYDKKFKTNYDKKNPYDKKKPAPDSGDWRTLIATQFGKKWFGFKSS